MPKTAIAPLDPQLRERVQTILGQLLEDRPYLQESANVSAEDLLSFLEIEEDSGEWLPALQENPRVLMDLWRKVQRAENSSVAIEPSEQKPEEIVTKAIAAENKAKPTRKTKTESASSKKSEIVTPRAETTQTEPAANDFERLFANDDLQISGNVADAKDEDSKKLKTETATTIVVSPKALDATVDNSKTQIENVSEGNSLAAEMALQASRAIAEQFAIVQYYEQQLEKSSQTIEDLNKRLNQARQQQSDTTEAYNTALEELAKLLATSLGAKAGEFSKLLSKVVSSRK